MAYPPVTNSGAVTSWIPLTTTFTPPASCYSLFRLEISLVAFDPAYGIVNDRSAICQPYEVTTWWEQGDLGSASYQHTYLSILPLTCPDGWTTVETSTVNQETTQAMCCPSQYSLAARLTPSIDGNCESSVTKGQVFTYASTGRYTKKWVTATTTMRFDTYVGAIGIVGYAVNPTATSGPTQTSSTSLPTSSKLRDVGAPTPPANSVTNSSRSDRSSSTITQHHQLDSSITSNPTITEAPTSLDQLPSTSAHFQVIGAGLSVAVKAGIGLGAGLGLIGICALLASLYILLRKKSTRKSGRRISAAAPVPASKEEHSSIDYADVRPKAYYGFSELAGNYYARELAAINSPTELEAPF